MTKVPGAPDDTGIQGDPETGSSKKGGDLIEAAHFFRRNRTTDTTSAILPNREENPAMIKDEIYPLLSKNWALVSRICRIYSGHVLQVRAGTRPTTTILLRHDDPISLRTEVRRCINDLDRREGGIILNFGKSITIEGGTVSRSREESGNISESIEPTELQGLVTRLEREMDVDGAIGEEDGVHSIRKTDYGRTVQRGTMQRINDEERTSLSKYLGQLGISGKDKLTIPQYIAIKLAIVITRPRNRR